MKTGLLLLVALLCPIAYFVLALGADIEQPVPVVHYLISLAAIVGLVMLVRKEYRHLRLAALVVAVAVTVLFAWYMQSYSAYEEREHRVASGNNLGPQLYGRTLPSHTGEPLPVLAPARILRGIGASTAAQNGESGDPGAAARATLLVFYRGYW